jgi:Zn-dependent protease
MNPSLRLGKIAGIKVGLHWSVALIALVLTFTLSQSLLPTTAPGFTDLAYLIVAGATTALFLGSIVAHELGHSLVARRNGVGIIGITLFALGGVAEMSKESDRPGPAFRIAAAGPAVSVGVGALSLAVAWAASTVGLADVSVAALVWLGIINLGLAVFNMLPAVPLDGGRVLQAALWYRSGDQLRATVKAASVGRVLGTLLLIAGVVQFFMTGSGLWTAAIGWYVTSGAKGEELRARGEILKRDLDIRSAAARHPSAPLQPGATSVIDGSVIEAEVVDH